MLRWAADRSEDRHSVLAMSGPVQRRPNHSHGEHRVSPIHGVDGHASILASKTCRGPYRLIRPEKTSTLAVPAPHIPTAGFKKPQLGSSTGSNRR